MAVTKDEVSINYLDQAFHITLALLQLLIIFSSKIGKPAKLLFHLLFGTIAISSPQIIHDHVLVNGELNTFHLFILRFEAAFHFGFAYLAYIEIKLKKRFDITIFMARGGTAMFMLIFQAITAYHLHEVKGKQMNFDLKKLPAYLYVYGVWMVGELIGIYRYQYNEEEELALLEESVQMEKRKQGPSGIQKCFLWDVVVCLLYAMICFSFPTQIMKFTFKKIGTIDSFHKLYFRYYGCYLIYSAMMSSAAYSFPLYMQKSYVVSRIITQAIIFILHMIGHWGYGLYSPNHITPFMVAGFYVTFMTSLFYKIKRRGEKEQVEEEIYEQEETYEQEVSAEEDEEEVEGEQINSRQTKLKTQ